MYNKSKLTLLITISIILFGNIKANNTVALDDDF
jgi:hypothetical protein